MDRKLEAKLAGMTQLRDSAETDIKRYAWRVGKNIGTLTRLFKTLVEVIKACWHQDGDVHVFWKANYVRVIVYVRDDKKKTEAKPN